jgi:hypothetical protein
MSETDLEEETASALKICVKSDDNLEMTVTKTSLSVFKSLGLAFQSAVSADAKSVIAALAPYVIRNDTGLPIIIVLKGSQFRVSTWMHAHVRISKLSWGDFH